MKNKTDIEPDTDLRDTENVPLKENIHDYFAREVLPHVPDAWIDETKQKSATKFHSLASSTNTQHYAAQLKLWTRFVH